MHGQSPSQTVGPFFHPALIDPQAQNDLTTAQTQGQRILIEGQVLDGDGVPVPDAMVEIWQADHRGIYAHPNDPRSDEADPHFRGFGRADTWNDDDSFTFKTVKPGPVPWGDTLQAPHINVRVFARGMLVHALTRIYFPDEAANADDPVLNLIEDAARRETLIAARQQTGDLTAYRFDIHLQGDEETVFFNP